MVSFSVDFAPLTAWWLLALVCLPAVALIIWAVASRTRGAVVRAGAALALALAIANPVINEEERAPLSTVVPVVVDRSQSQNIGGRTETADAALEELRDRLSRFPQFEVREVEAGAVKGAGAQTETRLFEALNTAIRDVPPSRLGGAIMITDGQVHDAPPTRAACRPACRCMSSMTAGPTSSTARSNSSRPRASRSPASPCR